ncbi:glycosyltransferase [Microbacterium pumilum]|uniref:Glycosyltransferase subfamily 4-like N-terminal domain-containing protein n=1 Tax=Microbacterium pumilum TaxID=344165 RepID=A0ABN2S201_9MICO
MKILVYPHDLKMGGSQTNAIELAAAVSKLGHECIIFGRRGTLCDRIDELGLTFIESPDPGRRPSLRIARALRQVAAEHEIDVIHGYEWPPALEAAMATERLPDVAAVCTVMSMAVAPFIPSWMPLIVGTQQISAVEQSKGRLNVTLLEPPVDLEHNAPMGEESAQAFRAQWGLDDRPLVVCVSRLVPELKSEGILTAIDAAAELADTHPFQFVIVGDGKARDAMQKAADRSNRAVGRPTVVLTGELTDPRAAYNAADIVLGMGGSALRSLAFGKPLVVQGEHGYFRTLTPDTVDEFRWQGWYGVGQGSAHGPDVLRSELVGLLADPARRAELGAFGRAAVEEFSLERSATRQVTIYRDAVAARAEQKKRVLAAGRSFLQLARYHVAQRVDRWRGRQRADDFNVEPVATQKHGARPGESLSTLAGGPILYFPGVGWDTLAGTDRQLATSLSADSQIVWVDTPHSILRRRDRVIPLVSHPQKNVVRLRAPTFYGVQRPYFRDVANRRRADVARRYLKEHGLNPRAVIASTTAPMLHLARDIPGVHVYYATDDFVEAAALWGVSKRYLGSSREANLSAADLVLAVTPELARHLQRGPTSPRWLPNGADLGRFRELEDTTPPGIALQRPIVGVIGQFNSRTDISFLEAVQSAGISLLLVGPRWFVSAGENEAFDRLTAMPGVQWIDALPRDALAPYLATLDAGLTPYRDSMFNRRSYPLKTLEYLASGVPVVMTDVASRAGLDPAFVATATTTTEFVERVAAAAASTPSRAAIRHSVASDGWDSRAAQLTEWLNEEARDERS